MVAAMLVGMVALGAALRSVLALAGLRYPTQYPEVAALEMAATMSAGMVAWMRHRRPRSQLDQPAAVARLLPSTRSRGSTSRTATPTRPAWRAWPDATAAASPCSRAARPCRAAAPHPHAQPTKQGAPDMPLLLLFIALVVLAILAHRFGVDSRDGADWSPPDRAPKRSGDPGRW